MKNAIKQICFLLFAISLLFILADCNFIGEAFSQHQLNCENACSDSSNQSENSHLICFEDALFANEYMVKSSEFNYKTLLYKSLTFNFLSTFSTAIWQPPKRL